MSQEKIGSESFNRETPENEPVKNREFMEMPDGTLVDITDMTEEERIALAKETKENKDQRI
jgi:hypothetical protein